MWIKRRWSQLLFIVSAIVLVFLTGIAWAVLRLPPANLVGTAFDAVRDLWKSGPAYFGFVPLKHLASRRFEKDGVVVFSPDRVQPGVTFMTGLFGKTLAARLYAADGKLIHEWPVDFFKVAPEEMRYPFAALIHGDHLYSNGDILANLDGVGILRVSVCGKIIWQNRHRSHHSLFIDDDGSIWAPIHAEKYRESALRPGQFSFDRVAKFDAKTGDKLDEIDLVAALIESKLQGLALSNSPYPDDMMHLNDVEILSATMAAAFPDFAAGDILLSSRNFSEIWVMDGATHLLKWWRIGPTIGQHDPDFQADGTITVFDNRPGLGGSRIVKIDPKTRVATTTYESDAANTFYSPYRGKHQLLANGNTLITESDGGRAFEVTEGGEVVWSFVNGYDKTRVGWIMSATRFPPEYAQIGEIPCTPSR